MKGIVKGVSLFMALILFFVSMPSDYELKVDAAEITTAYINGENIRVRETPTKENDNNVIAKLSHTAAKVLGKKEVSEAEVWYRIEFVSSNGEKKAGYIFYDPSYISLVTYNTDATFEDKLKAFPESYHEALKALHSIYPNWEFIPEIMEISFAEAVAQQCTNVRKKVQLGSKIQPISWRSMGLGSYDWSKGDWVSDDGGWTGASKEVIAFYMDPRNFLNNSEIYMFLQQSYNSAVQNESGLQKIIEGTFLAKGYSYTNESGAKVEGSYIKDIMQAASVSGVSPYVIASKIIQEQGRAGTGPLISGTYKGYEGYYNFFNVGATGATDTDVFVNGLIKARESGWTTRYKSIEGGANFLGKNYISKGQDTYYYQDFNIRGGGTHQYASAVHDAYGKGKNLASTYNTAKDMSLSFRIPVFTNMPEAASPMPEKSDKRNNYYFSEITIGGLTPSFNMYVNSYDLAVEGDSLITLKTVSGALNTSKEKYELKKGINNIVFSVKSETGYTNNYTISVNAAKDCILHVSSAGSDSQGSGEVFVGDTNGDGKITIIDLAKIQIHILGDKLLTGNQFKAGDINGDGKINIIDLARVQMHILGDKLIEH